MQLSAIRTRLQDVYGNTLSSEDTFYNRIINDAYRKVCALADWWWMEAYEVLTFNAPVVSALDYSCTQATAQIVASAATDTVTTAYNYGWAFTGENTYRVSTVSALTVTLDSNWLETSSAYQMAFWNDTKTLSTAFDHVISVAPRGQPNYKPLAHVPHEQIEAYGPNLVGHEDKIARLFSITRESVFVPKRFRIRIYPPPSEVTEYVMRYIRRPIDLVADTDEPRIPEKHVQTLVDFARLELAKVAGVQPAEIEIWETEAQKGIGRMIMDQTKKGNVLRQFGRRGMRRTAVMPVRLVNVTAGDPI